MMSYGKKRLEVTLQPVSGKAIPVYKGEVLRITLIEGPQCVDFNCFNLHDYKERMSIGHMRRASFRAVKGDLIWSNPPRYSPMMLLLEVPETCVTDMLGARCQAAIFERDRGFRSIHTNCQDTFAEAIGEYELSPDDVHDSLNFWMNTGWDDHGNYFTSSRRNNSKKNDYVELAALMDVLAVPITCGSGDVTSVSNYWLKAIKVEIFEPSDDTKQLAKNYLNKYTGMKNQRKLEDYRVKQIRTERELRPNPGYKPQFVNFPLKIESFTIELSDEDYKQVKCLQLRNLGDDDEDAIRSAVMAWITHRHPPQSETKRILFETK